MKPRGTAIILYEMTGRNSYARRLPSEAALAAPEMQVPAPALPHGGRRRRPVTIAQIAEESGLSTATVSKVLNGKPDVSPRIDILPG